MANLIGSLRLSRPSTGASSSRASVWSSRSCNAIRPRCMRRMDFASRDRYRHAVEEIAEPTGEAQVRVALKSVERARQIAERSPDAREAHVGYYLIGDGRRQFERGIGWEPGLAVGFRRAFFRHATLGYLGTIALGTSALVAAAVAYAQCSRLAMADADRRRAADGRAGQRADDSDSAARDRPLDRAAAPPEARPRPDSGLGAHDGDHPDDSRQRRAGAGSRRTTSKCRRSATSIRTSTSRS